MTTANTVRRTCRLASIGLALVALAPVAQARITQIVIKSVESPTFAGKSFGAVGAYERISGQVTGEVDPKDPRNATIVDIDKAPRNANGTVGYSTDFQILRPVDRTKGSGRMLYELTNRGRANALQLLNDSRTANDADTSGDPGNGFLMRQGYILLESGWDVDRRTAAKTFTATVPVAKNPDGSPITGLSTEEFVIDKDMTPAAHAAHLSGRERRQVQGEPDRAQELRRRADPGAGIGLGLR